jgi:hypothetical protein
MKANHWALVLPLAAAFTFSAAKADIVYFASATVAEGSCGADEVVWIDLDHGRYYKKGQADFAKSANGVYACEHAAHSKYREGKSEQETVANSK